MSLVTINLLENLGETLGKPRVFDVGSGLRVVQETLLAGLSQGVQVVTIDNGRMQVTVIPTRGMGLWQARCGDLPLGWQSPVPGPVHPSFVPLFAPDGIGWLQGFDEWLVRCGLESNGAPEFDDRGQLKYPLHGRIANLPVHRLELSVDDETRTLTLTGAVDEARLFGNNVRLVSSLSTRAGDPGFRIRDEILNLSARPADVELLYHINFGPPLVGPGAQVAVPVRKLAPRTADAAQGLATWNVYPAPQPGVPEQVFFFEPVFDELGITQVLLHNAAADRGVSLGFQQAQLPYFVLWKNCQAEADGYVTGLEPTLNFPNIKSFEKSQGRVHVLPPGGSHQCELAVMVHTSAAEVSEAQHAVARLQQSVTPAIHPQPLAGWVSG